MRNMWAPIIAALLQAVFPILEAWVYNWLAQQLHIAAASLPAPEQGRVGGVLVTAAQDKTNQLALLQTVRDGLWWFQFAKRTAVDAAIAKVKLS